MGAGERIGSVAVRVSRIAGFQGCRQVAARENIQAENFLFHEPVILGRARIVRNQAQHAVACRPLGTRAHVDETRHQRRVQDALLAGLPDTVAGQRIGIHELVERGIVSYNFV